MDKYFFECSAICELLRLPSISSMAFLLPKNNHALAKHRPARPILRQGHRKVFLPMNQYIQNIELIATKSPNVFDVELRLPFKTVRLGKIDFLGEGCFRSKRKWDNRHKKLNSWGVNAEIVEQYHFKWISIICDGKEYITSKPFLIQFGKRLTFKNYETQYFLPLELWGVDLVKEFEKQEEMKPEQLTLFTEAA